MCGAGAPGSAFYAWSRPDSAGDCSRTSDFRSLPKKVAVLQHCLK